MDLSDELMNVTIKQLRALVAIAQTNSFTLAAERMFLTQSALSGLIKELERSIGLQLVNRTTRRVQLSDVGLQIYPLIAKTLNDLAATLEEVKSLKALKKGVVRVAAPQLLASTILPEAIATFERNYPLIKVELMDQMVEKVLPLVFSGEADFAVGPEREPNSDIISEMLFQMPFVVVLPINHPLTKDKKPNIPWHDLSPYPVIVLQGAFFERLSEDLRRTANTLKNTKKVTFMTTALSMVHSGLGITVCLPYASPLIKQYGLIMLPLINPTIQRSFFIFTRKGRTLSPSANAFLDFFKMFIKDTLK